MNTPLQYPTINPLKNTTTKLAEKEETYYGKVPRPEIIAKMPHFLKISDYPFLIELFKKGDNYGTLKQHSLSLRLALKGGFTINKNGSICLVQNPNAYSPQQADSIISLLEEVLDEWFQESFGSPLNSQELYERERLLAGFFGKDEIVRKHFQFQFATNTVSKPLKSHPGIQMVSQWIDNVPQECFDNGARYSLEVLREKKIMSLRLKELRDGELFYHLYIPSGRTIDLGGFTLEHDPRIIVHSLQNFVHGSLVQLPL